MPSWLLALLVGSVGGPAGGLVAAAAGAFQGEVGFLEWTAEADGGRVDDGADSYVIRNGRIVAQTIHYTVTPAP